MTPSTKRATIVAGVFVSALVVVYSVTATQPHAVAEADVVVEKHAPDLLDWCAEGLTPIDGQGCFAAPESPSKTTPLVIYLHGMHGPAGVKDESERQARVARIGKQKGFAVLALRGKQGECSNKDIPDWWCFPSNENNQGDANAFLDAWAPALTEAKRRVGEGKMYLLGFSNGGYFAALIGTKALANFDGIVVAHAGPTEPIRANASMTPMLLISADDDPSDPDVANLDSDLRREKWPHAVIAREGGHALLDWDVDRSFAFFQRVEDGKDPFTPALARGRNPHEKTADIIDAGLDANLNIDAQQAPEPAPLPDPYPNPPNSTP